MDALRLLPARIRRNAKDYFSYNINFNTIAASATATGTTNIQGDSDFWVVRLTAVVTNAAGTTFTSMAAAPFTVEITDTASGRSLSDGPVALSNLFGTAQLPFDLPFPREFKASGQIQAKLQNADAGNAYLVRLSFHGFKVFAAMEPGRERPMEVAVVSMPPAR